MHSPICSQTVQSAGKLQSIHCLEIRQTQERHAWLHCANICLQPVLFQMLLHWLIPCSLNGGRNEVPYLPPQW